MDRLGFIHDKLDIKVLILFILRRLPGVVAQEQLREFVMSDGGVDYFDFTDCLSELVTGGSVTEEAGGYRVTDKGIEAADTVQSSLPYSVRTKVERLLAPLQQKMRRDASIVACHTLSEVGCTVTLAMGDGQGELIRLSLVCAGEKQAETIEKNFRRDAETYYQRIAAMLSES